MKNEIFRIYPPCTPLIMCVVCKSWKSLRCGWYGKKVRDEDNKERIQYICERCVDTIE